MRRVDPPDAGAITVRAVKRGSLYAFIHPEMALIVRERHRVITDAFDEAVAVENGGS